MRSFRIGHTYKDRGGTSKEGDEFLAWVNIPGSGMLNSPGRTQLIARFWQKRWLTSRIMQPAVLDRVKEFSLAYPVKHGAHVLFGLANEMGFPVNFQGFPKLKNCKTVACR